MSFSLGHLSLLMFLFASALKKSISSRISIECSLLGGFGFGKAGVSSVDFVVRHFHVGFRCYFANILRSFVDRFDISLETNKKAIKQHQYDIDKNRMPVENGACQFLYSYGLVIIKSKMRISELISLGGETIGNWISVQFPRCKMKKNSKAKLIW